VTILIGLFATGLLAGALGALLGLGGGIFLVPAMTLIFHLPIRVAVGTSLVGVIATSAGVAAMMPAGRGADIRLALRLEVATTAGAIAGGLLAGYVSPQALGILFAVAVFFTAGYTFYKGRRQAKGQVPEKLFSHRYDVHHWPGGLGMSIFAGMASGLLGVGGGFIKVPIMYAIMGVPMGVATATSNFMVGITAAASVFVYYGRGDVHPLVVIPTAVGIFVGAVAGVRIMPHVRVGWLRSALVLLMILIGLQMILHSVR